MARSLTATPADDSEVLLEETQADFDHFMANFAKYRKKYGGEYVAVHRGKIAGHDAAIEVVHGLLEQKHLDPTRVVIQYVPDQDVALIL